jgi:uncharacterized protein YjgD (DUF1641 family)
MNTLVKLPIAMIFAAAATTAAAECTDAEISTKTTEISTGLQALAMTDPEKMMEYTTALSTAMEAASQADDVEAVCTSLDEILSEMNG